MYENNQQLTQQSTTQTKQLHCTQISDHADIQVTHVTADFPVT